MTSADRVPTRAIQKAVKGRGGEVLDGARPVRTRRTIAQMAQLMRTGWFRQVHVKSRQCRLQRSLLVARRTVLNHMRSIESVVRAINLGNCSDKL